MTRGFGESSEFVTKRMCFSFLFSVGFLCLLCGFLLGRFASERSLEFRTEKKRLEFAGNGLENTEHLRNLLFQKLGQASYETDWTAPVLEAKETAKITEVLSDLSVFHRIIKNNSYVLATSHGSREPDRFVILSASGKGIGIAIELAKIFNQIQSEYGWMSRRTLVFCLFFGTFDICPTVVPNFIRNKVVAYIALYDVNLRGNGNFIFAASNLIKSMALKDVRVVENFNSSENHNVFNVNNLVRRDVLLSDLTLDVPHVAFSFQKNNIANGENGSNASFKLYAIPLAQLVGDTIWRLSESLVFHWDTGHFNDTISSLLDGISTSELFKMKDNIKKTIIQLISVMQILNQRIDAAVGSKPLDLRILNDLLMDLDRIILCPNKYTRFKSFHIQTSDMLNYLNELQKCYTAAIQLLQEW